MSFMKPQFDGLAYRLSAPGFLDSTDWGESESELFAIFDCVSLYGEGFDREDWEIVANQDTNISRFFDGYFLAVGFTATDSEGESVFPCSGEFEDHYDSQDVLNKIPDNQLAEFFADGFDFFRQCWQLAESEKTDFDWFRMGADFHFSRNGHGTGFWDRDIPFKDKLHDMAKVYGELEFFAE